MVYVHPFDVLFMKHERDSLIVSHCVDVVNKNVTHGLKTRRPFG